MHQSIAGTIDRYQSFGTVVLTSKAEDHYPYFASPVNQHFMLVNAFKTRIPDHVAYILRRHLDDATKVCSYPGTELKLNFFRLKMPLDFSRGFYFLFYLKMSTTSFFAAALAGITLKTTPIKIDTTTVIRIVGISI